MKTLSFKYITVGDKAHLEMQDWLEIIKLLRLAGVSVKDTRDAEHTLERIQSTKKGEEEQNVLG